MKKIRLYGAGGHSQVIKEVLEMNHYEITGVFDDNPTLKNSSEENTFCNVNEVKNGFPHKGDPFIIAIGSNKARAKIAGFLESNFEKAIHSSSIISSNVKISEGTVIFAGTIIQTNSTIGKHVIINTGASIDHDNIIEDFAHISPKVVLCGNIHVKQGAHIGAGSVILPNLTIGKWATIGAGTVVLENVPDYATVVGNPGKVIKIKEPI